MTFETIAGGCGDDGRGVPAGSSAGEQANNLPRERPVMGIKRYHDRVLMQISIGMSTSAMDMHRVELERLGRKARAACQFRQMLDDLKDQIAQKAAYRAGCQVAIRTVVAPSRAA